MKHLFLGVLVALSSQAFAVNPGCTLDIESGYLLLKHDNASFGESGYKGYLYNENGDLLQWYNVNKNSVEAATREFARLKQSGECKDSELPCQVNYRPGPVNVEGQRRVRRTGNLNPNDFTPGEYSISHCSMCDQISINVKTKNEADELLKKYQEIGFCSKGQVIINNF